MQIGEAGAVDIPRRNDQYGDAVDVAQGLNGQIFLTKPAPIWRWRDAVQHEFAARMQWTLRQRDANFTTSHPPVMSVSGSCGSAALKVMVEAGETVTLDASASYSPDPTLASMLLGSSTMSLLRTRRSPAK